MSTIRETKMDVLPPAPPFAKWCGYCDARTNDHDTSDHAAHLGLETRSKGGPAMVYERMERHGPLVYTENMGADEPVFHRAVEQDGGRTAVCKPENRAFLHWGVALHIRNASQIGVACDVCFPTGERP